MMKQMYRAHNAGWYNQSIFIRRCNYKQTTKKCSRLRLPEQAIAQQSWPP